MSERSPGKRGAGRRDAEPSHVHYRELLERHIDGGLNINEREELFAHLEQCEECRETLEAEERLLDRLSRIPRLKAPSDLRARILRDTERERREILGAFKTDSRHAPSLASAGSGDEEEQPPLPATEKRRLRIHALWRRYSPVAATIFLILASIVTLLTGNYSRVKPLAQLQLNARQALALASSKITALYPQIRGNANAIALPAPPDTSSGAHSSRSGIAHTPVPVLQDTPLDLQGLRRAGQRLASMLRGQISRLDRAAQQFADSPFFDVPAPAEREKPAMSAIVIKPANVTAMGIFDRDELGEAICSSARSQPQGNAASDDQFVLDGRRYQCYTLNVNDAWISHFTQSLEAYRQPPETPVMQVLSAQGHASAFKHDIAFYSAPGDIIRDAAASFNNKTTPQPHPRELRVFVVY